MGFLIKVGRERDSKLKYLFCRGNCLVNFLRFVKLLVLSWFNILGSIFVIGLVFVWLVIVKVLVEREVWILGLLKWIIVLLFLIMFICMITEEKFYIFGIIKILFKE